MGFAPEGFEAGLGDAGFMLNAESVGAVHAFVEKKYGEGQMEWRVNVSKIKKVYK